MKIFQSHMPQEWVVRETTGRDYGIDLYVEIVGKSHLLNGDMVAIQLKGTKKIAYSNGEARFSGIKRETLNYWLSLPVPVFLCVASLDEDKCYWANIETQHRQGRFKGESATVSIKLSEDQDFSDLGTDKFLWTFLREKSWPEVENAIEKSLMLFNTLGPLVLMCQRGKDNLPCSTTVQYLINQHYEYYRLLSRYLMGRQPKRLSAWYDRNFSYRESAKLPLSLTLYNKILKELAKDFSGDYRRSILAAYEMVTDTQAYYFSQRFPFLHMHLKDNPHTFVQEDWYARYFFDEYENETIHPEFLYFQDFDEYSHEDRQYRS